MNEIEIYAGGYEQRRNMWVSIYELCVLGEIILYSIWKIYNDIKSIYARNFSENCGSS